MMLKEIYTIFNRRYRKPSPKSIDLINIWLSQKFNKKYKLINK